MLARFTAVSALTMLVVLQAAAFAPAYGRSLVLDFLMVGDVQGWPNHLGDDEPAIDITLVPSRAFAVDLPDEYLYRQSRIYYPRSMEGLLEYEVLFLHVPRLNFFTPEQQHMMIQFAATEERVSIAYPLSNYADVQIPWLNSPVSEVFPVDYERFVLESARGTMDAWWENRPLRPAPGLPPVFSVFESAGIFSQRIYRTSRPCYAKEGATIWLYMIEGPPPTTEEPAFISWPYGSSDTWSFGVHPAEDRPHWEKVGGWWEMMFLNVCTFTINGEILLFDEAVRKQSVKNQFSYFRDSASMFQSIIDFVSRLSANTDHAESIMSEGHRVKTEAETDYLEREYEEAGQKMDEALRLANEAMDAAKRAKDTALTWIYVSEWMATTAVALLSGVVLWWLMVRRSLYRDVAMTRLRQR